MKSKATDERESSISFQLDGSVVVTRAAWQATAAMVAVSIALSVALVFSTFSMLELNPMPSSMIAAVAAVFLELALSRGKKAFKYGNIGLAAVAAVLAIFRPGMLADGLAIIRNVACEKSMEHQSYSYDMLPIGCAQPEYMDHIAVGMAFIAIVVGCIVAFSLLRRRPVLSTILVAGFFCLQIYFGIAPGQMLDVVLVALCALSIVLCAVRRKGTSVVERGRASALGASVLLTLAVLIVVGLVVYAVYPSSYRYNNPAVRQVSEQIRDVTALHRKASPDDTLPPGDEEQAEQQQDTTNYQQETYWHEDDNGDTKWSNKIPWPYFLIPAAAIALIVLVAIYFAGRHRVRKRMKSSDAHVAIEAWFRYLMRCLVLFGLARKNVGYSAYADDVGALLGEAARGGYLEAVALWQESTYSSHEMGAPQVLEVKRLVEGLVAAMHKHAKFSVRMKLRLLCYKKQR